MQVLGVQATGDRVIESGHPMPLFDRAKGLARAIGAFSAFVGALVLAGWLLDVRILKSVLPHLVTMKPNSAVCFIAAGLALWLACGKVESSARRNGRLALAGLVLLVGGATLVQYLLGMDFGIDQVLFEEVIDPTSMNFPARMAPVAALWFVLLGAALALLDARRFSWTSQPLAACVMLLSLVPIIGYIYGVRSLYAIAAYSAVALHTAVTSFILGFGLLLSRPERGLMAILLSDTPGGVVARRLLPAAIVLPPALGGFRVLGQTLGYYDTGFGTAVYTVAMVFLFTALISFNARILARAHVRRKESEDRLRQSEEQKTLVLDNATDAIITISTDGRIFDWNARAVETFGWTAAEAKGRRLAELIIPPDLRESHDAGLRRYISTGKAHVLNKRLELEALAKDGRRFPMELTIRRIALGDDVYFTGFARDLTSIRRAEAARSRLIAALESCDDAILTHTPEGVITFWNRGAERIFGYSRDEAVGKPVTMLAPGGSSELLRPIIENVGKGVRVDSLETVWQRKDGARIDVLLTISPVQDASGRVVAASQVARDMTPQKRAEAQLRRLNEDLRHRTVELTQKNQEVEAFVYIVSHDLRTPLVNLQGFSRELTISCRALAEILRDATLPAKDLGRLQAVLDEEIPGALRYITASIEKFERLINALVTLSRTGRQEYRIEPLDVSALVRDTLDSMKHLLDEQRIRVEVGALPPATADRTALGQVFGNLISNAVKYLRPGVPGVIQIGGRRADELVEFWVVDNGMGIPPSARAKLFQVFQRFHPSSAPGDGMGLAIVKRIVERHGGEVSVESEVAQGTTFRFTLPVAVQRHT